MQEDKACLRHWGQVDPASKPLNAGRRNREPDYHDDLKMTAALSRRDPRTNRHWYWLPVPAWP